MILIGFKPYFQKNIVVSCWKYKLNYKQIINFIFQTCVENMFNIIFKIIGFGIYCNIIFSTTMLKHVYFNISDMFYSCSKQYI